MPWTPTTEVELIDEINASRKRMSPQQRYFWEHISISPEKWQQHPYGNQGGGFWVVAIVGRQIIWYNDIERGWNSSTYSKYGKFNDYWCNQDDLEEVVEGFRNQLFSIKPGA